MFIGIQNQHHQQFKGFFLGGGSKLKQTLGNCIFYCSSLRNTVFKMPKLLYILIFWPRPRNEFLICRRHNFKFYIYK